MAIRPIVMFPDPRLHEVAAPITLFDDGPRLLAADLLDTMRAAPGIGITAAHIGVPSRLVVLELPGDAEAKVYANPRIVWASDDRIRHAEGSVSMPGVTEQIERHARVRVRYQDLNGAEAEEEADGLRAVCHQHEIDQLDGVFWVQKLSRLKRDRVIQRYGKLRRSARISSS